jgi:hypothetical protein
MEAHDGRIVRGHEKPRGVASSRSACDTSDGHLAVVVKEIEYGRTMNMRAGASTMSCKSTHCCAFITGNTPERTDRWPAKASSCSRSNPANTH